MGPDNGNIESTRKLTCPARMVNMCVRQPNGLQRKLPFSHLVQNHVQISTRINDGSPPRLVTPHQRAVLLEGGYGNGLVAKHGRLMTISMILAILYSAHG